MTAKFDKFEEALIALCDHHQITLSSSMYDQIQVWDRDPRDGALSGGNDLIIDRTKEQPTQPALTPPAQPPHQIT